MTRWSVRCALLLMAAGLATGCVERRYVITSEPPGALVYRNGRPLGVTPVDDAFVYYGNYHFTLVKDGFETLQVQENLSAPWYEYPPLDFLAENLWPFKVRDVRRPSYQLRPLQQVQHDDVLNRANELRARNKTLVPFNPASVPPPRQQTPPRVVTPPVPTATPATPPPPPPATSAGTVPQPVATLPAQP